MKRFCAMLLVFMLLAGSLFSYAEEIEEIDIVIDDIEEDVPEEIEILLGEQDILFDEEKRLEDVEDLDLGVDFTEELLSAEEGDIEADMAISANGTDVKIGDFTYNFDDGGGKIISYNGSDKSVDVPPTVDYNGVTYKVVSIAAEAFKENLTLESVTIPDAIISIGSSAFSDCTHLSKVTINGDLADCTNNWRNSHYRPFDNTGTYADSFTVEFGSGVTKIPAYIFNSGSSKSDNAYAHVTKVVIGDGVTSIGTGAFENCYDLTSITWGKGLLEIGNSAFESDVGLTEIDLPSKTYSLGSSAFASCTFLKTVTLPVSLNSIGSSVFSDCTHLSKVTINGDLADCTNNWRNAHYRPFDNTGTYADSFTVEFGNGVTKIPAYIFNSGSSKSDNAYAHVTKIIISDGVTSIGTGAFENCYDLASITWGNGLLEIGDSAFESDVGLTEIDLPPNTYSIGVSAFEDCTFLKTVTLPASLNSISSSAFVDCEYLSSVTINSDLADCSDNWRYAHYRPFRNTGKYADSLTVKFGSGVTKIPAYIFNTDSSKESGDYCHVSTVIIPASIKTIGTGAFYCCHDLATVKYAGSQIDWSKIDIGKNNDPITGANIIYGASGVAVTGVTLSQTSLSLAKGASATLTAVVEPSDATDKGIAWSSSNTDVATVNNGKVTAIGVGKATIKATSTSNTSVSASCEVTVTEETIPVTGVTISQSSLSLSIGGTATLTASVQPADATEQGITWFSSDTSVATVSNSGVVKAVAAGTATITAASKADSSKNATCKVTVSSDTVLATSIELDKSAVILKVGETATLTRTILPASVTTTKGSYKVSNKSVFKVTSSKISGNTCKYTIEAVGEGTATLTVYSGDGTKLSATCKVTVAPDIPTKDLTKAGNNGTVKIDKGTKLQLVASFATNKGWKVKSVTSSNKKVATVTSAGLVTAKKAGTATITVKTKNGKKATVKIKVIDPKAPTKVKLNKTGTVKLKKGKTLQLKATVLPDTAETTLTWKSSKPKVATVTQDGLVKARKKGTTTITVKTKNGKTAKVKIKVV